MNAPADPDDRQDLHNVSVDDEVADVGACGQVHLATGRTCTLDQGHAGSCSFVSPDQVEESLSKLRPDEK
jgi:hypothetical protein